MAKHTVAHIKSSSAWSKILCALMAIALLSLMVPSGLCAYANEPVVKQDANEKTDKFTEGVNNEVSANPFTLNSDATFIPSSVNAAETAGHFMVQTAEVGLGDVLKERGGGSIVQISNMDELYGAIGSANLNITWAKGLLNGYTEEETTGNIFADLKDALIFPSDDKGTEDFNKIIYYPVDRKKVSSNDLRDTNGYVEYMWVTLGEGDIFDMINHGVVHAKRLVPVMPAINYKPFAEKALLGSNLQADNGSTAARFLNWEVSFDGTNYMPVDWILETLEQGYFTIMPGSHYYFRANFYDMEGMTLVHLDFSGANTLIHGDPFKLSKDDENVPLASKLRADGWYTTDSLRGSVWTIALPNWMPTWLVYSYIFENYGENIFERGDVYKSQEIRNHYINGGEIKSENTEDATPYPGPHRVDLGNPNWEGTLDSETTITFYCYPISPMGRVMHSLPYNPFDDEAQKKRLEDSASTVIPETVKDADVMFYNEYGMPLFDYDACQYGSWMGPNMYYFHKDNGGKLSNGFGRYDEYGLAYCYDEEVDYAVVYAEGYNNEIYLPLYAEAKDFNVKAALIQDYGYADFQVERMMFGDLESAWFNPGVESYNVTYFEDGQPLFDTFTISNPWEIAMFGLPLVTNGTITTWQNTLVSGWNGYVHWAAPFGQVDPLNAFKDQNNFEASNGNHWFQVRIEANVKAGYAFDSWRYDFAKFSADVEGAGEKAVIVEEPILLDNHIIGAATTKVASADAADVEFVNPATANADGNVALASENTPAITSNTDGSAQTSDSASIACAILAALALAGCGIFAGRKLYSK